MYISSYGILIANPPLLAVVPSDTWSALAPSLSRSCKALSHAPAQAAMTALPPVIKTVGFNGSTSKSKHIYTIIKTF